MKRFIFILLIFLLSSRFSLAQTYDFSRLDNEAGLSNNQVEAIFKDSKGFMWFATNSGLNRYDGHRFKIFKHDPNDTTSIVSDKITGIQEDEDGYLWLRIGNHVYDIYNPKTESFSHNINSFLRAKKLPKTPSIITISKQKDIYAYYAGIGIYRYNRQTKRITFFRQSGKVMGVFSKGSLSQIAVLNEYIWLIFSNGLIERINGTSGKCDFRSSQFVTSKSTIEKSAFIDADGDLWIFPSFDDKSIAYMDTKTLAWKHLSTKTAASLVGSFVRFVVQDKNNLLWIGTDHKGIFVYDKKKNQAIVLTHDFLNQNSISQNSTISGYCDNNGIVWIGTYKNGINYYHPDLFKFKKPELYYLFKKNSEVFDCNSLFKDKKDNLWIGTNGVGLIRYDEKQNLTTVFRAGSLHGISSDIITSITEDHTSTLWIGTFFGGLNAYNGNGFKQYQFDEKNPNTLSNKSVYGVVEDKDSYLWIATLGGGINRLNPERNTFTHYTSTDKNIPSNFVLSAHLGYNGDIFFSTDNGIACLNQERGGKPYFYSEIQNQRLSDVNCNNVLLDSRGLVWIATNRGITIYHPKDKTYSYLTQKNGLPDDEVVSLTEDNQHQIWAGTRKGLSKITYSLIDQKESFSLTSFDAKDGLPSSDFNLNAVFKDAKGILYFGTTDGYVCFDPAKIRANNIVPHPRFTELRIFNNTIEPNVKYRGRVIIKNSISELNELVLKYDETNFSLSFSSLNYIHPEKNQYKYKLVGLENEWNIAQKGDGIVSYSNLSPGTYNLIVYASNNDGIWSKDPIELKIIVQPPFWATWWAYLIYSLSILVVLWRLLTYKLKKQTEEFQQAQIVRDAKKMHEVDELKFKFFTNISHEFKTPISLIMAPVDKLLKEVKSEEHKELLNIIYRNATNLLNMVNEILEFRKLDLNKMSLKLTQGDIVLFIRQICHSFSTLAKQKAIDFTFTSSLEKLEMKFDQEKIKRIITNLLSNAFKYTEYGEISVRLGIVENFSSEKRNLLIEVSDSGIGIEKEHLGKIFDRFYRVENQQRIDATGTGVGLHLVSEYVKLHNGEIHIQSEVNKGSVFSVTIPILEAIGYSETISEEKFEPKSEPQSESQSAKLHKNKLEEPLLLIVDDNEDFRNFIAGLFTETYRLIFAQDGEEALNIAIDQLPDVVLCDVMMPRMDGYEFCKKMKADLKTANIPVILITAKASDENKFTGFEAGADDYVSKPFSIDLLMLKVSRMAERRKKFLDAQKHKIDLSPSEIEIISESEKFVKKAIAIVEENMGNPNFLVEDLCSEMAMSRVGFYKQILSITEKTPSEFIRHIRLKRAADLLEKSELYVNEIAFQVGFNDPKYFRKYFKDEYGVTPNEYKKRNGK